MEGGLWEVQGKEGSSLRTAYLPSSFPLQLKSLDVPIPYLPSTHPHQPHPPATKPKIPHITPNRAENYQNEGSTHPETPARTQKK